MEHKRPDSLYAYGLLFKILEYMILLPVTIGFLFLSAQSVILAFVQLLHPVSTMTPDILGGYLTVFLLGMFGSFMCLVNANQRPDIRISDDGLRIRVFFFWWLPIPWEEVRSIRRPIVLSLSGTYLVTVARLTFVHRFVGYMYGKVFEPAFLIMPSLAGHAEVIATIKEKAVQSEASER